MMGHVKKMGKEVGTTDPLGYDNTEDDENYLIEQYLIAEPWLNILSDDPAKIDAVEVVKLRRELESTTERLNNLEAQYQNEISRIKKWRGTPPF